VSRSELPRGTVTFVFTPQLGDRDAEFE